MLKKNQCEFYQGKEKWIPIPKYVFDELVCNLSDEDMEKIALSQAIRIVTELLKSMRDKPHTETLMLFLKHMAISSGFVYCYNDDKLPQITITHEMSSKWSAYYATVVEMVSKGLGVEASISLAENKIFVNIEKFQ